MLDNLFRLVHKFSIIIYARLSKEDEEKSQTEQSQSILNQILICRKYIEEEQKRYPMCQFEIINELFDDGISGTTFNRDSFNILIKLIEEKKANMVITKDLSRLGRDHILTDNYVEKWFPNHNVRYVSVMENIDTYADNLSNEIAPIINWSNEHFARLTSKKIKKQFELLRKEGKWCGGEPPIGYKIDKKNKYHLVIDSKGALIVKKIFELAKQNKGLSEIAKVLTNEKIPIPTMIKGNLRNLKKELIDVWSVETIRTILSNEMYLGHMIQGKTTRLNHKSKTIINLPKERWVKVLNTHEPIIDENTFAFVQTILKVNKNKNFKSHDYLLKGLLKCNDCKHTIGIQSYNNRDYLYTICNYYRKYGNRKKVCTAHRFRYDKLEKEIIKIIKDKLLTINKEELIINLKKLITPKNTFNYITEDIIKYETLVKKYERQIDIIYEDKLEGLIDEEQFKRQVENKKRSIDDVYKKIGKLKEFKNNDKYIDKDLSCFINDYLKQIDRNIIIRFIKCISISDEGKIYIYYKFKMS